MPLWLGSQLRCSPAQGSAAMAHCIKTWTTLQASTLLHRWHVQASAQHSTAQHSTAQHWVDEACCGLWFDEASCSPIASSQGAADTRADEDVNTPGTGSLVADEDVNVPGR